MDDLKLMCNVNEWPQWPYLPIKKHVGNGKMPDCAVLIGGNGPLVYHGNMFSGITEQTPTTQYKSFEEILADGWEVD